MKLGRETDRLKKIEQNASDYDKQAFHDKLQSCFENDTSFAPEMHLFNDKNELLVTIEVREPKSEDDENMCYTEAALVCRFVKPHHGILVFDDYLFSREANEDIDALLYMGFDSIGCAFLGETYTDDNGTLVFSDLVSNMSINEEENLDRKAWIMGSMFVKNHGLEFGENLHGTRILLEKTLPSLGHNVEVMTEDIYLEEYKI